MRSLFELISKYRAEVIEIPFIALAGLILALFIYLFFNKRKWIKYVVGGIVIIVGLVFFIQGYFEILNETGLDFIAMATKILVFGFMVIFVSAILDLIDSFARSFLRSKGKKINKKNDKKRMYLGSFAKKTQTKNRLKDQPKIKG